MANLRTYAAAAWESRLDASLPAGATTISVADTTGAPSVPFYAVIEPGSDARRETVLVSGKTSTTFTLASAADRGLDGSSDILHETNVTIAVVPTAANINDLHDRVDAGDAALTTHAGAADPHPGYLTSAEGNAAYEAKVDRTGATAGEVPTLQGDGTLAFAAAAGGGGLSGARAYFTADKSIATATTTTLSWDAESYDDNGFWAAGTPTRLTIPTGVTRVRLSVSVKWAGNGTTTLRYTDLLKNGAGEGSGHVDNNHGDAGFPFHSQFDTGPITVAAGDYFEVRARQTSGAALNVLATGSFFTVEVLA